MIHSGILGFNIGASISNNNHRMSQPTYLRTNPTHENKISYSDFLACSSNNSQ